MITIELAEAIKSFGFPIVAAFGLGYFVYYVWTWVTKEIKPVLGEANKTLIGLIDRIRMLDNDMIRLNTKLAILRPTVRTSSRTEPAPLLRKNEC